MNDLEIKCKTGMEASSESIWRHQRIPKIVSKTVWNSDYRTRNSDLQRLGLFSFPLVWFLCVPIEIYQPKSASGCTRWAKMGNLWSPWCFGDLLVGVSYPIVYLFKTYMFKSKLRKLDLQTWQTKIARVPFKSWFSISRALKSTNVAMAFLGITSSPL